MTEPASNGGWPNAGITAPTVERGEDEPVEGPANDLAGPEAAARYSAWADRLRAKRRRDQDRIFGTSGSAGAHFSHWSADSLRDGAVDDPWSVGAIDDGTRALGVLGLAPGATTDEVTVAYRRLAKAHHPDRWSAADTSVQQEHAEAMMRINAAYRSLRPRSAD